MNRICFVVLFVWVVAAASAVELRNQAVQTSEGMFVPLGFWFPSIATTPTAVCTGCCQMQCVGGTCAAGAPTTCTPTTTMATPCFANVVSPTCTNLATCKTMPTAPCVAATVDCTTASMCPPAGGYWA